MSSASILFIAFIAIVSIQIGYYLCFTIYFGLDKPTKLKSKNLPLSVIICAKNEAKNLKNNLPYILSQNHSNFEIVLVNDSSSDDTLVQMKAFKRQDDRISVVDVKSNETFWGNKKYALTLGIKASKNDFLVFTDADCKPNSDNWLSLLSSHFSNEKSIVLGYGAYDKKGYSFLNKLIRFETVMTAIQYFSCANLGLPYMGVGRNMAYRKELFFNNSGYSDHIKIKSGDDDLFVNKIANKTNTACCIDPDSFTRSIPKTTVKDWMLQKRRHISTAKYYKPFHKIILATFFSSQLLFWILAIIASMVVPEWEWILALIALRCIVQVTCLTLASKKLNERDLIVLAPILDLFLISSQLIIFITNLIAKPKHWK